MLATAEVTSRSKGATLGTVHLTFDPEDHDGFTTARDDLLDQFIAWLQDRAGLSADEADEVATDASLALDWKFGYNGGSLVAWRLADLGEFLLEWCPRKLSVDPPDARSLPGSMASLVSFLDDAALLEAGSAGVREVAEAMAAVEEEFVAAMGDSSRFGLAKSLFAGVTASGVDLEDEGAVQDWIDDFNAQPLGDRGRVIPDTAFGGGPPLRLPAIAVPADDDVRRSKAAAPILATFAALARYVGDGRKLTQKGNIALADAKALVEVLGTGDPVDEQIGERTFATRSSTELRGLQFVFVWAKKAGIIRVSRGRIVATKAGLALSDNPAGWFDRAVDSLFDLGVLSAQRTAGGWLAWPAVNVLLDDQVVALLVSLYVAQTPVELESLSVTAADVVLDEFKFPGLPEGSAQRRVGNDIIDIVDALALAGLLRRMDTDAPEDPDITRRRPGGVVELTDAGIATVRRLLGAMGVDVPAAGRFADASAHELLAGSDTGDVASFRAEFEMWKRARTPARAAADLAAAVRDLDDAPQRILALALMGEDVEASAPHVRDLANDLGTRGFAQCWLVDHGLVASVELFDRDDLDSFVDVLTNRLIAGGPDSLIVALAMAGDIEQQMAVLEGTWRAPSTATTSLLDAIGTLHPDKRISKAARKALFKRRSGQGIPKRRTAVEPGHRQRTGRNVSGR